MNQKLKQYKDEYNHAKKVLEAKSFILFDEIKEFDGMDELKNVMVSISILDRICKEMTESIDRICGDLDGSKHLNSLYNIYGNGMLILENTIKSIDNVLTSIIGMKYFKKENILKTEYEKGLQTITTGALCTWSKMIDQLAKLGH